VRPEGRAFAIANLIRLHGPEKATALVKEADAAHAEGRKPDFAKILMPARPSRGGGE
jgi:hypothetical protein